MEDMLELEMKKLRQLHAQGAFEDAAAAIASFTTMLESFQADTAKRQENGLLSRMELRKLRLVEVTLEQHLQNIRKRNFADGEAVWAYLRSQFAEESDIYEDQVDKTGGMLEHAFDFMEAAFGGSQEMVLFVTELNTGFYSLHFLQEYECERYYQYNKNLLFSDEEQEIAKILKEEK